MPETAKPRKSANSRSAPSRNGSSAKKTSSSTRARSTASRAKSATAKTRAPKPKAVTEKIEAVGEKAGDEVRSIGNTVDAVVDKARDAAGTIVKGTAAATVGAAVAAVAGKALISSRRRKRVLGVPMPRKRSNVKSVAKQFSGIAGNLEKKSLDVSNASARAKEAAKILS